MTLGSSYFGTGPGVGAVDGTAGAFTYTQATSTSAGSPTANANYFKFSNVTGGNFTVTMAYLSGGSSNLALMNGFQIVAIPEPSSVALALGGFGMLIGLQRLLRRRASFLFSGG
jgi:hypothetical protein